MRRSRLRRHLCPVKVKGETVRRRRFSRYAELTARRPILMLAWCCRRVAGTRGGRIAMNRAEFESELCEQGYQEIADRRMSPNATNPEHAHEFDARLLVLEGEERTYRAGENFAMTAGR